MKIFTGMDLTAKKQESFILLQKVDKTNLHRYRVNIYFTRTAE